MSSSSFSCFPAYSDFSNCVFSFLLYLLGFVLSLSSVVESFSIVSASLFDSFPRAMFFEEIFASVFLFPSVMVGGSGSSRKLNRGDGGTKWLGSGKRSFLM
eukprot:TRINITY_DN25805_c0_g1_i1.p2 TRINITY_DN25805_c0_g1~~TRINITY_DN25805_c0_g1_i1.p2  ORF type:complete len:101 (+),score=1.87 TRINITY_DN25805_c0_g1_i1:370-672(+)